jgi:hypothetical protein
MIHLSRVDWIAGDLLHLLHMSQNQVGMGVAALTPMWYSVSATDCGPSLAVWLLLLARDGPVPLLALPPPYSFRVAHHKR